MDDETVVRQERVVRPAVPARDGRGAESVERIDRRRTGARGDTLLRRLDIAAIAAPVGRTILEPIVPAVANLARPSEA